jgi:NDP-4-keto-2,6-dideoxyhexose 3-C-methyltransferase
MIKHQTVCRICGNANLVPILDLGKQALSGRFPHVDEPTPPIASLSLVKCHPPTTTSTNGVCGLVQLAETVVSDELYFHQYGYRSGLNRTMTQHLSQLVESVLRHITVNEGDVVVDIGSNDSTLLKNYDEHLQLVGIDPIGHQFREFYPSYIQLIDEFFTASAYRQKMGSTLAKIVTSVSMFYDLPAPMAFVRDIQSILHPQGIWVLEQSYLVSMLSSQSFDTVCHEHLEYYALRQIEWMVEACGMHIIDMEVNACNGGSFRLYVAHQNSSHCVNTEVLKRYHDLEKQAHLDDLKTYEEFRQRCDQIIERLRFLLNLYHQNGLNIDVYGASTKGNVLLQYLNLRPNVLRYAVDRNPEKYGRRTPQTDLPIVSEDHMRQNPPDVMLVLPWHFKQEFIEREKAYLDRGGLMIFPLPQIEIIDRRKTALIVGSTGQIGHYLGDHLVEQGYHVYGMSRHVDPTKQKQTHICQIQGDINQHHLISQIITTLLPNEIYHLASPTTIIETVNDPLLTYQTNIMSLTHICETIRSLDRPIRLLTTSSSEIYRGHLSKQSKEYTFSEQDTHFKPRTPYAFSKAMSQWVIDYYRTTYHLPFYVCVLGNVISPRLRDGYLMSKVVKHVQTNPTEILRLGNINLKKDFLHAHDVARAMWSMMVKLNPNDYVVTSGQTHSLCELIDLVYQERGFHLRWYNNQGTNIGTDQLMVLSDASLCREYEIPEESLCGRRSSQLDLVWHPEYTLQSLVHEMYMSS